MKKLVLLPILALALVFTTCDMLGNVKQTSTVSFNANAATSGTVPSPMTAEIGSPIILPEKGTLSKNALVFSGWCIDPNGLATIYPAGSEYTVPNSNTILYAIWLNNADVSYTVTFNSNGGSSVPDQTIVSGDFANRLANPSRNDYQFDNWYTDPELSTIYNFSTPVTANITLYAKWTVAYTVTFNSNGGDSVPNQNIVSGGTAERPTDPERNGFYLDNWYIDPGLTIPYDFSSPVTSNIILYAKWIARIAGTSLVIFDTDGGSYINSQLIPSGTTISLPPPPTKEHYTFGGWYSDTGLTSVYNPAPVNDDYIILYAKWIPITYTVAFNSNGGSSIPSQPVASGSQAIRPDSNRDGYSLVGWYIDVGQSVLYDFSVPITGNITLYAKWDVVIPSSVSLDNSQLQLPVGGNVQLIATVLPTNALNQDVTWTSDKPAVARVTNGIVVAEAVGTAVITATTVAGNRVATCVVRVVSIIDLHPSMIGVLGNGYDITGRYVWAGDVRASVLDINKLRIDGRFIRTPNLIMADFNTTAGETIQSYQEQLATKVSASASGSAGGFIAKASFSMQASASFGLDRAESGEYAFATQSATIVKDAYVIQNRDGLHEYFTPGFAADLASMSDQALIAKYGTHVMLGGVMGARYEYHMSVKKYSTFSETKLSSYVSARASAKGFGYSASAGASASVDAEYSSDFRTSEISEELRIYGGQPELGYAILTGGNYDAWFNSIDSNWVWTDYYPNSLILLSDLVPESRQASLLAAIEAYCEGKIIEVASAVLPDRSPDIYVTDMVAIRGSEQTIYDIPRSQNYRDVVSFFTYYGLYIDDMKQRGYKTINFYIRLQAKEYNDGYAHMDLCNSSLKGLTAGWKKDLPSSGWHDFNGDTVAIDINEFINNEFVIGYYASGSGADTWINRNLRIQLEFRK